MELGRNARHGDKVELNHDFICIFSPEWELIATLEKETSIPLKCAKNGSGSMVRTANTKIIHGYYITYLFEILGVPTTNHTHN